MIYRLEVLKPDSEEWVGPCRDDIFPQVLPLAMAFGSLLDHYGIESTWDSPVIREKFPKFRCLNSFHDDGWKLVEEAVFRLMNEFKQFIYRIRIAEDTDEALYGEDGQAIVCQTWFNQNAQEV